MMKTAGYPSPHTGFDRLIEEMIKENEPEIQQFADQWKAVCQWRDHEIERISREGQEALAKITRKRDEKIAVLDQKLDELHSRRDEQLAEINRRSEDKLAALDQRLTELHRERDEQLAQIAKEYGAKLAAIRAERAAISEQRAAIRDQRAEISEKRTEISGQRAEISGQRAEIREKRTEISAKKADHLDEAQRLSNKKLAAQFYAIFHRTPLPEDQIQAIFAKYVVDHLSLEKSGEGKFYAKLNSMGGVVQYLVDHPTLTSCDFRHFNSHIYDVGAFAEQIKLPACKVKVIAIKSSISTEAKGILGEAMVAKTGFKVQYYS